MSRSIPIILTLFTLLGNVNVIFAQSKITEKEIIGNWVVTGGSGKEFEKEMIGLVITFDTDHKLTRYEKEGSEKLISDWKFENNVITITSYYNDGINDPEIETLTITSFDGKKITTTYTNYEDEFIIIFEKAKMP